MNSLVWQANPPKILSTPRGSGLLGTAAGRGGKVTSLRFDGLGTQPAPVPCLCPHLVACGRNSLLSLEPLVSLWLPLECLQVPMDLFSCRVTGGGGHLLHVPGSMDTWLNLEHVTPYPPTPNRLAQTLSNRPPSLGLHIDSHPISAPAGSSGEFLHPYCFCSLLKSGAKRELNHVAVKAHVLELEAACVSSTPLLWDLAKLLCFLKALLPLL